MTPERAPTDAELEALINAREGAPEDVVEVADLGEHPATSVEVEIDDDDGDPA